jgi:predicted acyltransferase
LFHQTTEVWQCRRWAEPFVWIGMNPIAIYLAHNLVDLGKIARRFVGGDVNQWFGRGGEMMVALAVVVLTFGICRFLYRRGIFLRL